MFVVVRIDKRNRAREVGAAVFHSCKVLEKQRVVCRRVGRLAGISCASHPWRTSESLDLKEEMVSQALINLSRAHIIRFIPRKFIPRITFLQRRVELEEIVLPPAVYDERKEQLANRIETMIGYIETDECHSRYLLRYFGETDAPECGLCNNCLDNDEATPTVQAPDLRQRITDLLRQRGPMPASEIRLDGIPSRQVGEMLHEMFLEEELTHGDDASIVALREA